MESYKDFYIKTIEESSNLKGLKLVLGGTGLGKTSGLLQTIDEYVNKQPEKNCKFIYLTHRHNLISQQEKELKERFNISTTYLKSNREIIMRLRKEIGLRDAINHLESLDYFKYDEKLSNKYIRQAKFKELIKSIDSNYRTIENDQQSNVVSIINEELNLKCSELFNILKRQSVLINGRDKKKHESLQKEKIIWSLFPYVEFENNPDCNVLLVTIHKTVSGFFNGKEDIKLTSITDKIVFLDEFDFLESDILKILCDDPSILNPLEFVTIFYKNFKHWSNADFWDTNEELRTVKEKFEKVIKYIDKSCEENRINLTSIVDFRLSDKDINNEANVLFQTNQLITPKPFYLKEKDNSLVIENNLPKDSINPRVLFNILTIATNKIVSVFNYFKHNQILVGEIIQKVWNQKNDNQGGIYEKYIKENMLYHRKKNNDRNDKDDNSYKNKSTYEIGYRLIKLLKRSNTFDPKSAELSQIELFATPESLIAKLADSNLIFALSATTDLPRTLKCFNLEWLKKNTFYIPLDESDYRVIQKKRDEKKRKRNTSVNLRLASHLLDDSSLQRALSALSEIDYFNDYTEKKFKLTRASKAFETINQIMESDKFAHLVFLTTFKQVKQILDADSTARDALNEFGNSSFQCSRIIENSDKFFHLKWNKESCHIILLNANDAKNLETSEKELQNYRNAFKAEKVIVITQYNSASNGVNLPCYDKQGGEADFTGLHLLEENHFWFDDEEEDFQRFKNIEKQAFWYLWKLWDTRQISKEDFKKYLNKRAPGNTNKPDIKAFDDLYRNTLEKTLNAISLYHQAIGRIERKWKNTPEVNITLDESVFREFHKYLTTEDFYDLVQKRDNQITSALILETQRQVIDLAAKKRIKEAFFKPKSIRSDNDRSEKLIKNFLRVIEKLKQDEYDDENAIQIRDNWHKMRELVLKHDFKSRLDLISLSETLDMERDFCFETNQISKNKEIFLDRRELKIYPEKKLSYLYSWNLDYVYNTLNKNQVISNYFKQNNYMTSFDTDYLGYKSVFTPYIYQAILQGAVGEKAIEALLEDRGIALEHQNSLPNSLFEVVDAKVKGCSIYLDFKNFSKTTLNKFHISEEDPEYEYQFDSVKFIEKQVEKYRLISANDSSAIFYVINLYSEDYREPDYFDSKGKRQSEIQKSCIRIIPNVLVQGNENKTSSYFQLLVQDILSSYEKA